MDAGIIIARFLQIGIGVAMLLAVRYRKRKFSNSKNSSLWKVGEKVALTWGWIMIIASAYNLLIYLAVNLFNI